MDPSLGKSPLLARLLELLFWSAKTDHLHPPETTPQNIVPESLSVSVVSLQVSYLMTSETCNKNTENPETTKEKFLKFLQESSRWVEKAMNWVMQHLLLVQGFTILLSVVLSAMVFFPLGTITADSGNRCLLFSSVYLSVHNVTENGLADLNLELTEYGSDDDCNYTTFFSVVVAVAGLIFLWFLIHFGRVSEIEQSGSAFLVLVFVFYLVLLVCAFVSSVKISAGFSYWCSNIKVCSTDSSTSCNVSLECDEFSLLTVNTYNNSFRFYTYLLVAEISSWILTLTLLFECLVTSQRIYENFKTSLSEDEQTFSKEDKKSDTSTTGVVNLGSDDYPFSGESSSVIQASDDRYLEMRILTRATVHQSDATFDSMSGYERPQIEAGQNLSKTEGEAAEVFYSRSEVGAKNESDHPRTRNRKTRGASSSKKKVGERDEINDQAETHAEKRDHENIPDKKDDDK